MTRISPTRFVGVRRPSSRTRRDELGALGLPDQVRVNAGSGGQASERRYIGAGDGRELTQRGLLVRMPGQPPEHIQRRLDRLRAQRAAQIAKEGQKTACPHEQGSELLALVARNGAMHIYNGCRACHANLENGRFHPAENIDVTVLPVGTDLRLDNPPCQVCGSFGTELHHWAPTAVFGSEAALWPTAQLCPDCHGEWHRRFEEYYAAKPPHLFRREA